MPPLAAASQLSPLLRLSPHVRRRIYRFLGLATWDGTAHRFFLHAGQPRLRQEPGGGRYGRRFRPFVADPGCFHGLLLPCRVIYAEAAALLYSTNQFILYYSPPRADPGHPASLRPLHTLHALTAPSLLCLSNLKVVLNEAACHQLTRLDHVYVCCLHGREKTGSHSLGRCKEGHEGMHQPPLLSPASAGDGDGALAVAHAVLTGWQSSAARLLSHVAPGRLTLSLVCDIDPQHPQALDIASSIVAPIRLLPASYLRECHIRLAKTKDRRLEQLAKDTVLHACEIPTPALQPPPRATTTSTTLLALPREIRVRILEYTDLVTPRRQVAWTRQDGAYSIFHFRCGSRDPLDSNQFSECWANGGSRDNNGCFCRRRHAAFSTRCKCWAPPGPALFLICRTLCEDAQFVFFSSNRFIIHDYNFSVPWVVPLLERRRDNDDDEPVPSVALPYPQQRISASEFLRDVVPTRSLAHLRFLEVVFPPYRPATWPETHHPAMQDWWSTVDWLRDKLNPPGLTIRLGVAEAHNAPNSYYRTITTEEGATVMTAYMDLMRPLRGLADAGLAGFFAHFPYPWKLTEASKFRRLGEGDSFLLRERDALKKRAEQHVMGRRYEDLYANGKEEPEESDWGRIYYGPWGAWPIARRRNDPLRNDLSDWLQR